MLVERSISLFCCWSFIILELRSSLLLCFRSSVWQVW